MHRDQRRSIVEVLERRFLMSSTLTYNRTAAVAYANQYWDEVVSDGWFWISGSTEKQYTPGSPVPVNASGEASGIGDDCAHFVSSCIGTPPGGGGGGLSIPSRGDSSSSYGEPAAGRLDALLVSDGYAVQVSSINQLQPGDVIGYDWDGDSGGNLSNSADIDHTAIYMGNGVVDAHSTSHSDANWTLGGAAYYFFIHITLPSSASPATPTNSLPANNAAVTTLTPNLTASAFSESGATQSAAEWEIFNGSTLVYDSGADTTHKTSLTVPTGKLSNDNTYTWEVRYEDNSGNWSSYSTATSFAVAIGPYTPVNSSPANNAVFYNPVTLSAGAFSDTLVGATHTASEWIVKNSSGTTVFDSGTDGTDLSSISITTSLALGQTYSWRVRYEDNSGYWSAFSTATSFTIPTPSLLTLGAASAYYLQDSANGQSLNIWNSTTDTGTPSQTVPLGEITTIIIDGASTGSNITIDFANGGPSPSNRITVLGSGSSSNNILNILGSANGNDTVSFMVGQYTVNGTIVAYSTEGTTSFTPGAGTDSLSVNGGTLALGATPSGNVNLSALSISAGATLNIGSDIVNLFYTSGQDPESTIQSLINTAYNNNTWTGTGLTSSLVAANPPDSAVGYYDNGSAIVIRATWDGDANCDGVLNADDLSIMALGIAKKQTDWSAGNFNYDTQINADDSFMFDFSVAYANGRNYTTVFAPGVVLGSSAQMSQLLSTPST